MDDFLFILYCAHKKNIWVKKVRNPVLRMLQWAGTMQKQLNEGKNSKYSWTWEILREKPSMSETELPDKFLFRLKAQFVPEFSLTQTFSH